MATFLMDQIARNLVLKFYCQIVGIDYERRVLLAERPRRVGDFMQQDGELKEEDIEQKKQIVNGLGLGLDNHNQVLDQDSEYILVFGIKEMENIAPDSFEDKIHLFNKDMAGYTPIMLVAVYCSNSAIIYNEIVQMSLQNSEFPGLDKVKISLKKEFDEIDEI